ncbi:MAG TPA: efflux RND transporter permease subunit, partial [Polyangiaceae bacterium]|nr:efflux RND transporter permease subunit [Polyangiaceae bacterium]
MTLLSLRNPIAILMLCVGVVVFAGVVTPRMSVDTFPELTPPVLIIGEVAPGLPARDVEKAVAWRIERYVAATPGVDHVESLSRNNFALIYVWLKWGTDLGAAQTLVQSEAAFAMAGAPKSLGLLPPFVLQYDPSNAPVCQIVITGAGYSGAQLYDYAQNYIEPQIEGIDGVGSAPVDGGRPRQINIVVDPVKAQSRHVTAEDIAAAVGRSNALLPSGEFITPGFDANVYTNAVPQDLATIGRGTVKVVDDRPILIEDVARIEDGGMPQTQSVSVNGNDAVYLNVLRIPGGNTIAIVDAVKDHVAHLKNLPPGMKAEVYFDQSTFVRNTYEGLQREILQALVLVALVILLFLQSVRGTLIVSVAIPLSFAITLIVLYSSGQTLNAITLGGLTLAMGRLVDNAVVVLESIHRERRAGRDPYEAALHGTNAVALPVLASTLTTIAVLLPVVLLAGLAKRLFAPLALTVAVAMIASYFVSIAVTPVACRYFLGHGDSGPVARWFEARVDALADAYTAALRRVLPVRSWVLGMSLVLVASSVWAAAHLPSTFFPDIDESMDMVYVRFAPGISVQQASEQLARMGRALSAELPPGALQMVVTNVGMPEEQRSLLASPNVAPNTGFLRLALAAPEHRVASQQDLAVRIREILTREFPGIEVLQYPGGLVASVFANGYLAPLVVELEDDNLDALDAEAKAVADVARTIPGIRDVRESLQIDYPEIRVNTDREKSGFVGTSVRDAAQTTLEATTGNINSPGVWVDANNGRAYYVVTYYDGRKVTDTHALGDLPVHFGQNRQPVLLGAYSDVVRSTGAVAVERSHMARVARVLMQTEGRDLGSAAAALEEALRSNERSRNIPFHFVGQVQLMRTTFSGLGLALSLAVMVVFMIMASQFKSLRLPLIMLFTIPVALWGIVMALAAAGQGFSITALMGVLMVIGIAVSNGILLVDDASRRLAGGLTRLEAILQASRSRFVPIVMTSLATVIGLVPTALALERGSEANQPLALAVVGGLASSTVISLFLVPSMFVII